MSNAGGLGIISAMNADENYVRDQIRLCRELTDKPFGVNIMLMSPHVEAVAQLVIEERVPVVTTGAGLPGKYMPAWIEAGIKVVPVVPSVAIARRVEKAMDKLAGLPANNLEDILEADRRARETIYNA